MKKTLFIIMLVTFIVFAQDTTNTQLHIKDTLVTKSISVKQNDTFFNSVPLN